MPEGLSTETIITQILCSSGLFILLWIFWGRVIFRPFLAMLEQREQKTSGAEKHAQQLHERTLQLASQLEESLRETRVQGIRERDAFVERAKSEARRNQADVMAKAQRVLEGGREEIRQAMTRAEAEVEAQVGEVSQALLHQALNQDGR